MDKTNKYTKKNLILIIAIAVFLVIFFIFEFMPISLSTNELQSTMIKDTIIRFLGGFIFMFLMISSSFKKVFTWKRPFLPSLFVLIPGLMIAINNFPIIAYLDNRTALTEPSSSILIFALECLSIGFFEEVVFRGLILILVIQKYSKTKKELFFALVISSSIFGLIHVLNLFLGASFYETFLQVGYSFLMGMLWSVVFLKTKNIWFVIFLHASYNFFGRVITTLGTVSNQFDTTTIIITITLSVIVCLSMLYVFLKTNVEDVQELYI